MEDNKLFCENHRHGEWSKVEMIWSYEEDVWKCPGPSGGIEESCCWQNFQKKAKIQMETCSTLRSERSTTGSLENEDVLNNKYRRRRTRAADLKRHYGNEKKEIILLNLIYTFWECCLFHELCIRICLCIRLFMFDVSGKSDNYRNKWKNVSICAFSQKRTDVWSFI